MNTSNTIALITAIFTGIPLIYAFVDLLIRSQERKKKQLTSEIISNVPLVYISQIVRNDIKTEYKNAPINSLNLLRLKIKNTGNKTIEQADYDINNPHTRFSFGNGSEVLEAGPIESEPDSIKTGISIIPTPGSGKIDFNSLLLNENESVTLEILVNGFENEIKDDTRLKNVKQILKAKIYMIPSIKNLVISVALLTILSSLLLPLISRELYYWIFYLFTSPSFARDPSIYAKFYLSDTIGGIISGFIMSIIYTFIDYRYSGVILSDKNRIDLTSLPNLHPRGFTYISLLTFSNYLGFYGLISVFINAYIERTFRFSDAIPADSVGNLLNTSDAISSFIVSIIIIILVIFLKNRFPLKVLPKPV